MAFTKNQILQLEIESLSSDGNGVAHSDRNRQQTDMGKSI